MGDFRLSHSADQDVVDILTRSHDEFGSAARERYADLITAAILHAADHRDGAGFNTRAELGEGVMTWHLNQSTRRVEGRRVRRPVHVLVCRWNGGTLVVGRVFHERMDPTRHIDPSVDWE